MKKWITISVIAVLIIGGGSWFLIHKKQENASNDSQQRSVQTVTAKQGKLEVAVSGSGSVTAATDQDVTAANTVLSVASVSVAAGDSVSKGDTLVTFTNGEEVTAANDGDIASVAVSKGSVASQGTILLRLTNEDDVTLPVTRGNSSNSANAEGGAAAGSSSLTVDTVKAAAGDIVTKGQTLATFTDGSLLLAPAAGTLTSINISSGDTVGASDTVAHITDFKTLQTTISVDELDISKIKTKQAAEITASAFEDETFEGTVTSVASTGNSENGVSTFDVTISIKDPKSLKVGMSTEAKIVIESKDQAIYVPLEAVYTSGDEKYVLIPSGDSSEKVTVETGLTNDTYTEITKGLDAGASVQIPQVQSSGSSSGFNRGGKMMDGMGGQGGGMPSGGGTPPSGERPSGMGSSGGQGGK